MRTQNTQVLECLLKSISEDEFFEIADTFGINFENATDEEIENLGNGNYLYFLPKLEEIFEGEPLDEKYLTDWFTGIISEETLNKTFKAIREEKDFEEKRRLDQKEN